MIKQTTLMHTTPHYTNNKPQQNPAQTATSQPRRLAAAPLNRGAYGLTFRMSEELTALQIKNIVLEAANLTITGQLKKAFHKLTTVPKRYRDDDWYRRMAQLELLMNGDSDEVQRLAEKGNRIQEQKEVHDMQKNNE